jgi:hypothetical protein
MSPVGIDAGHRPSRLAPWVGGGPQAFRRANRALKTGWKTRHPHDGRRSVPEFTGFDVVAVAVDHMRLRLLELGPVSRPAIPSLRTRRVASRLLRRQCARTLARAARLVRRARNDRHEDRQRHPSGDKVITRVGRPVRAPGGERELAGCRSSHELFGKPSEAEVREVVSPVPARAVPVPNGVQ